MAVMIAFSRPDLKWVMVTAGKFLGAIWPIESSMSFKRSEEAISWEVMFELTIY